MKKVRFIVVVLFFATLACYGMFIYQDLFTVKHIPPSISFDKDVIEVSVKDGNDVLLAGVRAYDDQDGDVTSSLIVEERTRFIAENTRSVSYVAFDKDHNAIRNSRKIVYKDYKAPVLKLNGPLIFASSATNFDPNSKIEASSCLDGDLTSKVRVLNSKDYIFGDNVILVSVSDTAGGETSMELTCTINELYRPDTLSIELNDYIVYVNCGDFVDLYENIASVLYRGQEIDMVPYVEYNQIDTSVSGIYEVNYHLTLDDDEAFSRLVVVVR